MPNCYSLTRNGKEQAERLILIDEDLCNMMGVIPHPTEWLADWENTIGLLLALGKRWDEIQQHLTETGRMNDKIEKIITYLRKNYKVTSWYQVGGF